jgi:hypothetical protein
MNAIRAKYQRRNINNPTQPEETEKPRETKRATTTIIETKIERPYSRKVVEQRVEMDSQPSNNRFGRMPKTVGRYSAIDSNKTNNEITINTTNREKSLDKYKRQNKEKENDNKYTPNTTKNTTRPINRWSYQVPEQKVEKEPVKWKRFSRLREEEKPKQEGNYNNKPIITSKTVKEEKTEKTPNAFTSTKYTKTTVVETERNNTNKPDEKVVKTEVHIVKTKTETPKESENKNESNEEPKANYRFRKYRANKTDEDLPPKKEDKEKEDIKVESRKRKTFEPAFNPYSRKLKDMKIDQNTDNNNEDNNNNVDNNKRGYYYYKKKNNKIEEIDNNKTNIDNFDNEKKINEDRNNNPKKENTDDNNNNYKYKSYKKENPDNLDNNKYKSYNNDNNNNSKYRTTKTEPPDDTENSYKYKSYSKMTKKDGNKKVVKEKTIEENINETDRKNRLKNALNEIERVCAERTLKNDLIELFNRVLENNMEFKDDIFFRNLTDTERRVGNMDKVDKKNISHTYKEIETSEILSNLENANDLMNKYTQRAKTVVEEY